MAITISCAPGDEPCQAKVLYDASGDPNIRAFGLDLEVTEGDANIIEINDVNPGYWVYPGSIVIVDGEVNEQGTADANGNDFPPPGTLGGLGTPGVTVEMGSLYVGDLNAPEKGPGALLFTFTCDASCTVTITENDARGGVVQEDAESATVVGLPLVCPVVCQEPTCWDYSECSGQYLYADATCDGAVNLGDLFAMKTAWGAKAPWVAPKCCADFNHSGQVDLGDLFILKTNWNGQVTHPERYVNKTGNQNCP
jgi:hypothetical protein